MHLENAVDHFLRRAVAGVVNRKFGSAPQFAGLPLSGRGAIAECDVFQSGWGGYWLHSGFKVASMRRVQFLFFALVLPDQQREKPLRVRSRLDEQAVLDIRSTAKRSERRTAASRRRSSVGRHSVAAFHAPSVHLRVVPVAWTR